MDVFFGTIILALSDMSQYMRSSTHNHPRFNRKQREETVEIFNVKFLNSLMGYSSWSKYSQEG